MVNKLQHFLTCISLNVNTYIKEGKLKILLENHTFEEIAHFYPTIFAHLQIFMFDCSVPEQFCIGDLPIYIFFTPTHP